MLRSMFQRDWSRAIPLADRALAPRGPGLYVIGRASDSSKPIGEPVQAEGKMGGFPANMQLLYIGCSKSNGAGVRGRLSSHARGRGNKAVAAAVKEGVDLYFSYVEGMDSAGYEAIYLHFLMGFRFPFNRRPEDTRYLIETARGLDAAGFQVIDPFERWDYAQWRLLSSTPLL